MDIILHKKESKYVDVNRCNSKWLEKVGDKKSMIKVTFAITYI